LISNSESANWNRPCSADSTSTDAKFCWSAFWCKR